MVHHKECWNWSKPVEGVFPREVCEKLLKPYIMLARPALAARGVQTLFVNTRGLPLSGPGFTIYYSNV